MEYTKEQLEKAYTEAFEQELKAQEHRGYVVVGENEDGTRHEYEDTGPGKFYLCGFASLHYDCRTPEGRKAHKYFKTIGLKPGKNYYGGFNVDFDSARYHSNGFYEIMVAAYQKVAKLLEDAGYPVYVDSRLD